MISCSLWAELVFRHNFVLLYNQFLSPFTGAKFRGNLGSEFSDPISNYRVVNVRSIHNLLRCDWLHFSSTWEYSTSRKHGWVWQTCARKLDWKACLLSARICVGEFAWQLATRGSTSSKESGVLGQPSYLTLVGVWYKFLWVLHDQNFMNTHVAGNGGRSVSLSLSLSSADATQCRLGVTLYYRCPCNGSVSRPEWIY